MRLYSIVNICLEWWRIKHGTVHYGEKQYKRMDPSMHVSTGVGQYRWPDGQVNK